MPISTCIITKNEENYIADCLQSISAISREMIVVDTGSTDNTVAIAKENGAQVFHDEWDDDFAKAKNKALSYARQPWILSIDADEIILECDIESIKHSIELKQPSLITMIQTSYSYDHNSVYWKPNQLNISQFNKYPGFIESRLVRLFPNHPDLRFVGCVHENIEPSQCDWGIYNSDIRIHHYGFLKPAAAMNEKKYLYATLAQKKMNLNVLDPKAAYEAGTQWWELGSLINARAAFAQANALNAKHAHTLFALGSIEYALHNYDQALNYFQELLAIGNKNIFAMMGLSDVYDALGNKEKTKEMLEHAQELSPDHPMLCQRLGLFYRDMNQFEKALHYLNRAAIYMKESHRIFYQIGMTCLDLKDFSHARNAFIECLKLINGDVDVKKEIKKCYRGHHLPIHYYSEVIDIYEQCRD